MLGDDDDDDDDECPSRRLINNLADISDKAIPAKRRDRKNGHHSNTMEVFMKKGEEKTMKVMKERCKKLVLIWGRGGPPKNSVSRFSSPLIS